MNRYRATAVIGHPLHTTLKVEADTYFNLCIKMHRALEPVCFYTAGVNGDLTEENEPYTKDLIFPQVKWDITRDEGDDKKGA